MLDVLHYSMPTESEVKRLYQYKLAAYQSDFVPSTQLIEESLVLSHAEIIRVSEDDLAIKSLENRTQGIHLLNVKSDEETGNDVYPCRKGIPVH